MSSRSVTSLLFGGIYNLLLIGILLTFRTRANPLSSLDNVYKNIDLTPSFVLHSPTSVGSAIEARNTPLPPLNVSYASPGLLTGTPSIPINASPEVIFLSETLQPSHSRDFEPQSSSPSADGIGHLLIAELAQSMLSDFNVQGELPEVAVSPIVTPLIVATRASTDQYITTTFSTTPSAPTISATLVTADNFPTAILSSFLASAVTKLPEVIPSEILPSSVADGWDNDNGIHSLLDNLINPQQPLSSLITTFRPTAIRLRLPFTATSSIQNSPVPIFSPSVVAPLAIEPSLLIPALSSSGTGQDGTDKINIVQKDKIITSSFFEAILSTVGLPSSQEVAESAPSETLQTRPTVPSESQLPTATNQVAESILTSIPHLEITKSHNSIPQVVSSIVTFRPGTPGVELLLPYKNLISSSISAQIPPSSTVSSLSPAPTVASVHETLTDDQLLAEHQKQVLQIQDLSLVRPSQPDATVDKIIAGLMDIIRPLKVTQEASTVDNTLPLTPANQFEQGITSNQHPFSASEENLSSVLESLNSQYLLTEQDHRITNLGAAATTISAVTPLIVELQSSTTLNPSATNKLEVVSAYQDNFQLQEKNEPVIEVGLPDVSSVTPPSSTQKPQPISQAVLKRKPATKRPIFAIPTRLRTPTTSTTVETTPSTRVTTATTRRRPQTTTATTTTTEKPTSTLIHSWGEAKPIVLDFLDNTSPEDNGHLVDSRLPVLPHPIGSVVHTQDTVVGSNVLRIKGGSSATSRPLLVNRPALIFAASSARPNPIPRPTTLVRLPISSPSASTLLLAPSIATQPSSATSFPVHNTPSIDEIPQLLERPLSSSPTTIISSQATVLLKPSPASSHHLVRQTILNTVVTISDSSSNDNNEEFAHFDNGHSSSNQLMSSSFDLAEPFEPAAVIDPPTAPVLIRTPPPPPPPTTDVPSTSPTTTTTSRSTTTSSTTTTSTTPATTTKKTRRPFFSRRSTTTKRPRRSTTTRRPLLRLSTTAKTPRSTTTRKPFWPFRAATTRKPSSKRPIVSDEAIATTTTARPMVKPAQSMMSYGMSLLPAAVIATIIGLPLVLASGRKRRDVHSLNDVNNAGHWRRLIGEIGELDEKYFTR